MAVNKQPIARKVPELRYFPGSDGLQQQEVYP